MSERSRLVDVSIDEQFAALGQEKLTHVTAAGVATSCSAIIERFPVVGEEDEGGSYLQYAATVYLKSSEVAAPAVGDKVNFTNGDAARDHAVVSVEGPVAGVAVLGVKAEARSDAGEAAAIEANGKPVPLGAPPILAPPCAMAGQFCPLAGPGLRPAAFHAAKHPLLN